MSSETSLTVALDERAYDIKIGAGILEQAGDFIAPLLNRPETVIVTDETVASLHLASLQNALQKSGVQSKAIILPAGEATKSFAQLERLCAELLDMGVERKDHVIALGGGVIGDLTGFAASILRRGVRFIQVPTTLLAQVDSSVGGKTGINVRQGKNLIGAFHQPGLVLADTAVLNTLSPRDLRAGYAEVVKYGLLGDAGFFEWLDQDGGGEALLAGDGQAQMKAVYASCAAKAAIVAEDEKEAGKRALLNLGHTFGHALEAETGYSSALLHGEGVAVGMGLAFRTSEALGLCEAGCAERVEKHFRAAGMPATIADIPGAPFEIEVLMHHMGQDKKVEAGQITFVLARAIGDAFTTKDVPLDVVRNVLEIGQKA